MKLNIGLILAIVVLAVVVVFQAVQISSLKNDVQLWGKMADIGFETLHQFRTGVCAPWSAIVVDNIFHIVTIWIVWKCL